MWIESTGGTACCTSSRMWLQGNSEFISFTNSGRRHNILCLRGVLSESNTVCESIVLE
jgi:hypothetical protein